MILYLIFLYLMLGNLVLLCIIILILLEWLIVYNSDWIVYFYCLNKIDLNELDNLMLIYGLRKLIVI